MSDAVEKLSSAKLSDWIKLVWHSYRLEEGLALTRDAVQVSDQENAQQNFGIDRWATRMAVASSQRLAHESEVNMLIDQPQEIIFRNMVSDRK